MWTTVRLLLTTIRPVPGSARRRPRLSCLWPSLGPPAAGRRPLSDHRPQTMSKVTGSCAPPPASAGAQEPPTGAQEPPAGAQEPPAGAQEPPAGALEAPARAAPAADGGSPKRSSSGGAPTRPRADSVAEEDPKRRRQRSCSSAEEGGAEGCEATPQSRPEGARPARDGGHVRKSAAVSLSAEEILEKVRKWVPVRSVQHPYMDFSAGPGFGLEFTVVSYNVLSQHLFNLQPDLYKGAEPAETDWEARAPRIWQQIVRLQPDIICLQEVEEGDIEDFWKPRCKEHGLDILYKRRTGKDKRDGCAVLYRRARFSLSESATVEYLQPGCESLDRDNVGIVARLRSDCGELVVACTHLLYNPRRHDVKLAQLALLLAEVDRLAWCGRHQLLLPVLLAGDLNLEPFSPVYEFLRRGWLQYGGMSRRWLTPYGGGDRLLAPLLPARLGVSALCQHAAVLARRRRWPAEPEAARRRSERRLVALAHSERAAPPPPLPLHELALEPAGYLGHGLRLRSAYEHGPPNRGGVTTRQGKWVTVDYIFHSGSSPPGAPHLQLLSRLALPTAALCQRLRPHPSEALPSDHLPLAARYRLVPTAPWWAGHFS